MYGFNTRLTVPFDAAIVQVTEALKKEGFGVLSDIDVKATMKAKLDIERRPYRILGACNPPLAHKALTAERDIGVLLPCNVVVYQGDDPGQSVIAAVDPEVSLGRVGNTELAPLAKEVKQRLGRVLDAVGANRPAGNVG